MYQDRQSTIRFHVSSYLPQPLRPSHPNAVAQQSEHVRHRDQRKIAPRGLPLALRVKPNRTQNWGTRRMEWSVKGCGAATARARTGQLCRPVPPAPRLGASAYGRAGVGGYWYANRDAHGTRGPPVTVPSPRERPATGDAGYPTASKRGDTQRTPGWSMLASARASTVRETSGPCYATRATPLRYLMRYACAHASQRAERPARWSGHRAHDAGGIAPLPAPPLPPAMGNQLAAVDIQSSSIRLLE
ncbi:hypothetical protein B0H16DRAFT_1696672 [Mycena metata]|uniref:Uncharacterized protein n=1 Tax=Mycena metata TaxID=1033252 RepID=A0AAD7HYX3_9AGAR|nr:hypothetical protein B0H16DRAFT_1696672 [Mycena metata]